MGTKQNPKTLNGLTTAEFDEINILGTGRLLIGDELGTAKQVLRVSDDGVSTIYGDVSIEDNMITTAMIQNSAVTTAKIADASVTTAKMPDSAVTTAKIANLAVTTDKIGNTAVTETRIATDAITSGKIYEGAVTTAKMADSAVTTAKIADGAVTAAKLSGGGGIADGSVTTAKLADEAVTYPKISSWKIDDASGVPRFTTNGVLNTGLSVISSSTNVGFAFEGSYTSASGTIVAQAGHVMSGSGLVFSYAVDISGNITNINITDGGSGYRVGDRMKCDHSIGGLPEFHFDLSTLVSANFTNTSRDTVGQLYVDANNFLKVTE